MLNFDGHEKAEKVDKNELERNIEYSVEMMRWMLQVIGLWPCIPCSKILRMIKVGVVSFLLTFFTVRITLYILIVITDFKASIQLFVPLSFGFMNIFKFYAMMFQEDELRELVEWMALDWRSICKQIESDLMLENARTARTLTIICIASMYVAGMSFSINFMINPIDVNKTAKVVAYANYSIFFKQHEQFKFMYTMHVMCTFAIFTISVVVESIGITCVMHVCGQITIVSWRLRNLDNGNFDRVVFGQIIQKHLHAIRLAEKLEDYLSDICLMELIGCCFNICMLGYYMITDRSRTFVISFTSSLLFISFIFNLFIFCYIGDQLTEKCGNIQNVAYNFDWYHLPPKDAKNLLMIVVSTTHPVVLTAGKMTVLSLTCFSNVLKLSFSYLNLLKTVT